MKRYLQIVGLILVGILSMEFIRCSIVLIYAIYAIRFFSADDASGDFGCLIPIAAFLCFVVVLCIMRRIVRLLAGSDANNSPVSTLKLQEDRPLGAGAFLVTSIVYCAVAMLFIQNGWLCVIVCVICNVYTLPFGGLERIKSLPSAIKTPGNGIRFGFLCFMNLLVLAIVAAATTTIMSP